jgi:hypothetical protein
VTAVACDPDGTLCKFVPVLEQQRFGQLLADFVRLWHLGQQSGCLENIRDCG